MTHGSTGMCLHLLWLSFIVAMTCTSTSTSSLCSPLDLSASHQAHRHTHRHMHRHTHKHTHRHMHRHRLVSAIGTTQKHGLLTLVTCQTATACSHLSRVLNLTKMPNLSTHAPGMKRRGRVYMRYLPALSLIARNHRCRTVRCTPLLGLTGHEKAVEDR